MARLVALVAVLAALSVVHANTDKTNKENFFIFSKSKGADVGAVPTMGAGQAYASGPAPCTQVCNDKCDTVLTKSCSKVPTTTTACAMVKVVNVVKQCNKKCTTTTTTPIPPPTDSTPTGYVANPSAMPQSIGSSSISATTVTNGPSGDMTTNPAATAGAVDPSMNAGAAGPAAGASDNAAGPAAGPAAGASDNASGSAAGASDGASDSPDAPGADVASSGPTVTVQAAGAGQVTGRKLLAVEKKQNANKENFLPLLLMAGKGLAKMQMAQQQQQQQQNAQDQSSVVCEDVCADVPVEGMENQCHDVTSLVDQCTTTPSTTCVKECTCASTSASMASAQAPMGKGFMLPMFGKGKGMGGN